MKTNNESVGQPAQPPKKRGYKKGCLACGGSIFILLVIIGIFAAANSGNKSGTSSNPFTSMPVVTLAEYNQIQHGMTYEQVKAIVGEDGVENASNQMPAVPGVMESISTKSYIWQNKDGSNAILMFQNDKVMQKAQALLK